MKLRFFFLCLMNMALILSISFANEAHQQVKPVSHHEEKGSDLTEVVPKTEAKEILDFNSIKDLIKKDGLEDELKKKEEEKRVYLDKKKISDMKRFNVPVEDAFWNLMSEYWLVKNAPLLKWDFHKPEYELEKTFIDMLEKQGIYEKKIKILLIDSTEIIHASLPSNDQEFIFILSLPFIRTLDLSKVEIALLLLEDFLRARRGYFKKYLVNKELEAFIGSNFNGKPFDKKLIKDLMSKYSTVILEKGFSFQEQFEITTEMDTILKNDLKIWNTYLVLLEKMDQLTKGNTLYKKISQIYPSPELQINWIKPKPSRF